MKQLEYEKEGEKRIKLAEIDNQIEALNDEEEKVVMELSPAEKVYLNNLVSYTQNKKFKETKGMTTMTYYLLLLLL